MAGITEDGPHVVTDERVLGQAGILDVVNDGQVPGQPMFSGPDFLSDHTFSEAMPSGATRTDDLSSNASRANRSRVVGLIVLTMMIPSQDVMMTSPVLRLELNPHLSPS